MNEIDALNQLTDLVQKIELNNWDGIYKKLENNLSFTPRTMRQQKEIETLKDEKRALEIENQTLRIKVGAVNNILNGDTSKAKEVPQTVETRT
jgi:regulator of replication initiation timing